MTNTAGGDCPSVVTMDDDHDETAIELNADSALQVVGRRLLYKEHEHEAANSVIRGRRVSVSGMVCIS